MLPQFFCKNIAICIVLYVLQISSSNAQITIVGWDGANFNYAYVNAPIFDFRNPYANTGIVGNKDVVTISTFGGVSPSTASDAMGDGNQVIFNQNPNGFSPPGPGEGWINGSGAKGYSFNFKTTGFKTLKFSGKLAATNLSAVGVNNFNGARDFKLQYSLNGTSWQDVAGAAMVAGLMNGNSLTFNTYNNVVLPSALDNQANAYLRLIMTSNNAVGSGTATTQGMVYLDDVKVTADITLPVTFSSIRAEIKNNLLLIHWSTNAEKNNDHFEVQVSEDGNNFKTIATIKTKAFNGNSDRVIEYDVKWDLTTRSLAAIPFLFALIAMVICKRKHYLIIAIISISAFGFFVGCNKKDAINSTSGRHNIFVRIVQVDEDKTTSTSDIVKTVINE